MNLQKIVKSQKYRHNGKIGIRSIEVFFKEAKQHLGLCNCQSRDFDAQIASVTIVVSYTFFLPIIEG